MSNNMGFSQGIEIAALKKPGQVVVDLMRPGNGTPWEDRGSTGAVGAYFKTVAKSLTSPALLMDHIRRPETTGDAASFARVSVVMWVIGILLWNIYSFFQYPTAKYEMYDPTFYWVTAGGQAALVAGGWFLWMRYGTRMYTALAGNELRGSTSSLVFNCFAYGLGPSILAVVPVIGWGLALAWIFADLVIAGKRRLFLKTGSAVTNAILVMVSALVVAAALCVVLHFLWSSYLGMDGLKEIVPVKKTPLGARQVQPQP